MFNSGFRGKRAGDNQGTVNIQTSFVQNIYPQPTITGWSISGTDDTALNPAGGQTVLVNGTGFASGVAATLNGSTISPVTLVNPTQISFTSPALAGGSYSLIVYNSSGGAAILVPGLVYSSVPTYTTAAGSIGNIYETNSISTQVIATSDSAITYSLASGTLPSGATLYANGVITGTAPVDSASTTYTFGVTATDAELQDVTRTFTLTINTDNVTWSNPSSNTSINLDGTAYLDTLSATSAAGKSITYTANSLPTGLTLSTATISGTPTIAGTTTTLLTATAATTNRINQRTITWIVELNDPYFKYVTLLLNGETTVTPFINDASANSLALIINGDTKPVLFNPYQGDGYYSNYFDGTGDYLTVPGNSAYDFGSGNFTLECWIYPNTTAGVQNIFDAWNNTPTRFLLRISSGQLQFYANPGTSISVAYTLPGNFTSNWHHVACVRNGSNFSLYLDGVSVGTPITNSGTIASSVANWTISRTTESLNGYISNLRVVKGTAVYTAAFTPSTTPLTAIANTSLLTCQSNRFIDNSTNNFTITKVGDTAISSVIPFTANSSYSTYGSTYFDGTDYLTATLTGGLGSGDFTVEYWAYHTSFYNYITILSAYRGSTGWNTGTQASAQLVFFSSNGETVRGTTVMSTNTWYHVAFVRSSGVIKGYLNGIQNGTTGTDNSNFSNTDFAIGRLQGASPGEYTTGYISDVRIVVGTALYTSNFTPTTTMLTPIANTRLLTLQYNGGATNQGFIDNSNFNNIITRNGNPSQGTFSPYSVTGWSNYFDGTGDYITAPSNSAFAFLKAAFTVEMWIYPTATITTPANIGLFYVEESSGLVVGLSSGYLALGRRTLGYDLTSSYIPPLNTWTHVAVTRSGATAWIFANGVQVGTVTAPGGDANNNANYVCTTGLPTVAGNYAGGAGFGYFPGYISNVRIIKGTGVYTGAFTPSTTPLTAITNTSLLTCQSNRFIDNSINNFTLTRAGDTSVQAFGPFGSVPEAVPISYSVYFDGTGDYLQLVDNVAVDLGTGNFTIEFWFMRTATPTVTYHGIVGGNGSGFNAWSIYYTNGNEIMVFNSAGVIQTTTGASISNNIWYHVAVVKNTGVLKVYVNGVERYSASDSSTYDITANGLRIGDDGGHANGWMNGYISNLRVVKGTAVYTSAFTPSTTPLTAISGTSLLTCQSTRMIDNSTNAFTITAVGDTKPRIFNPFGYTAQTYTNYSPSLHGGSIYLDGTVDNLYSSTISKYGSTNHTIECWVFFNNVSSRQAILNSAWNTGSYATEGGWTLDIAGTTAGGINFALGTMASGSFWIGPGTGVGSFTVGQWYHIAIVRNSTTVTIYSNGVSIATGTLTASTTVMSNMGVLRIGAYDGNGFPFNGYISDVRVSSGALYTSNFVPPTVPLTPTVTIGANTFTAGILVNGATGGIIDQHGSNVLETVGNTQLSTAVKKYNNASMYFDGTGDTIIMQGGPKFAFGSGNFTIEFWVYFISTASQFQHIYDQRPATTDGAYPTIRTNNTSLEYVTNGSVQITGGSISTSQWYHVAVTRSSGSTKLFLNGAQIGSTYTDATVYLNGTNRPMVGGSGYHVTTNVMVGYIDDLRITIGYARYTSNFTPPTSAFPTR